jgi:hypothetical protein
LKDEIKNKYKFYIRVKKKIEIKRIMIKVKIPTAKRTTLKI